MSRPSRADFEAAANRNIRQSLANFLPDNGHTYVNGSFSRKPHWHYERDGVREEAYQNTMNELNITPTPLRSKK